MVGRFVRYVIKKQEIMENKSSSLVEYLLVKPFSINQAFQGRRFKTKAYDTFIQEMLYTMPKKKMIKGEVEIKIWLHLKSITRSDIDNFCKPIIDCIVKKGWIADDRYIQHLEVHKIKNMAEAIEIEIKPINPPTKK